MSCTMWILLICARSFLRNLEMCLKNLAITSFSRGYRVC